MPIKPSIAVIDDDESIRDATVGLLRSLGFITKAFSSAEDFLNSSRIRRSNSSACIECGSDRLSDKAVQRAGVALTVLI